MEARLDGGIIQLSEDHMGLAQEPVPMTHRFLIMFSKFSRKSIQLLGVDNFEP